MNKINSQITDTILMIKPIQFNYNPETAINNYYQVSSQGVNFDKIQAKALEEFNNFVEVLEKLKIEVIVVEDTINPPTPDSIFPNNWVSFHSNGKVGIYPMFAKNRRLERRIDILETIKDKGFKINEIIDFSTAEEENIFLEGTGSMVLDRISRKVYCAISPRSDLNLLNKFCEKFDYTPVSFKAYQWAEDIRLPIYHTNVLMAIGETFAIICLSSIDDLEERNKVINELEKDSKEIIEISEKQVEHFAGNALQVKNSVGEKYLLLSETAKNILTQNQIEKIEKTSKIVSIDIDTIQKYGGGSVRCMMAEIFLPKEI